MSTVLPVDEVIPALTEALRKGNNAVLQAPPGAGKTTRIPLALLSEAWLNGNRILMLEPRRLAARNAAYYMARQLGESVGETVGYRVRMSSSPPAAIASGPVAPHAAASAATCARCDTSL